MKRFRAHIRPLLLTCVIVLFFVSLLNITTSFAQDAPFARLKTSYRHAPILSLSPDGQTLATIGPYSGIREVDLWDVKTGKFLRALEHPESTIRFISFISDRTLLSATGTSIYLWDVSETFSFGTLLKGEDVPGDETTNFLLSPDGQTLAYYAWNDWRERSVYLWDISDSTLLKEFRDCSGVFSFSRDSQTFLTHCGTRVDLWDVSDSKFLASFDGEFDDQVSTMSPDGKTLVLAERHNRELLLSLDLWDVSEDTLLQKIGIYSRIHDISFSPDGQTLAVSSFSSRDTTYDTVDLWDISTGELRNTFKHSELGSYMPPRILFSPDGQTLLSGLPSVLGYFPRAPHGYEGLGLWDVETGRLRNVFQGSTDVRSISFISDAQIPGGQILATVHKTLNFTWGGESLIEILLWRVGPAVPAVPDPVAAKSLLEEFISLKDPFEAVAGVAPPYDKLDDNDRLNLRVNWEDIAKGVEEYEGNESLDVNQDGSVNKRDLQLVEFALTLDFDAICPTPEAPTPEAKSLLAEFIGLHKPFEAVAGVAPPYDKLDDNDRLNLRVNWEDIAKGVEEYEGNESLDVNQDGSVNKRDLQLVEFALTLDTDGDGTLSAQEMVSPLSKKFPLTAASSSASSTYCPKVHVIWCYPNDVSPDVWVNRGRKVNITTVPSIMADVHKFYSNQVTGKNVAFDIDYASNGLPHKIMLDYNEAALSKLSFGNIYDEIKAEWLRIFKVDFSQTKDFYIAILQSQNPSFPPPGSGTNGVARGNFAAVTTGSDNVISLFGWKTEAVSEDQVAQVIAHELGHLFGLAHLFQKHNIMAHVSWGWNQNRRADTLFGNHLTLEQAKWISNHAAFNGCPIASVSDTQIAINVDPSDSSKVSIKLTDPDEIYMIQLRVKVSDDDSATDWESRDWKDRGVIEILEKSGETVKLTSTHEIFSKYKFILFQVIALDKRGDTTDKAWEIEWADEPANAPAAIQGSLLPQATALLVNYPNPFNPETWIPYQLATPADVALTIYDIQGRVVRALDLGHQRAGMYQSRARAAHWDGRNAVGEPVATGVYFYTLTAGDFSATRKMLIRK